MKYLKICILIFSTLYIFGCVEKTTYSGKIISQNDLSNLKIDNKDELFEKFGQPSFIDSIQNKYFYFTEIKKSKNFYDNRTEYSYLFIFEFDKNCFPNLP